MQIRKLLPAILICSGITAHANAEEINVPDVINSKPQKSISEEVTAEDMLPSVDETVKINSRPVIFNSLLFDPETAEKLQKAYEAYYEILATRELDDAGGNLRTDMPVREIVPKLPEPVRQVYLGSIIYDSPKEVTAWINDEKYKLGDDKNSITLISAEPDRVQLVYDLSNFNFNFKDGRLDAVTEVKIDKEKKQLTFWLTSNHRLDLNVMRTFAGKTYHAEVLGLPIGATPEAPVNRGPSPMQQMRGGGMNMQPRPGVNYPAPLNAQGQNNMQMPPSLQYMQGNPQRSPDMVQVPGSMNNNIDAPNNARQQMNGPQQMIQNQMQSRQGGNNSGMQQSNPMRQMMNNVQPNNRPAGNPMNGQTNNQMMNSQAGQMNSQKVAVNAQGMNKPAAPISAQNKPASNTAKAVSKDDAGNVAAAARIREILESPNVAIASDSKNEQKMAELAGKLISNQDPAVKQAVANIKKAQTDDEVMKEYKILSRAKSPASMQIYELILLTKESLKQPAGGAVKKAESVERHPVASALRDAIARGKTPAPVTNNKTKDRIAFLAQELISDSNTTVKNIANNLRTVETDEQVLKAISTLNSLKKTDAANDLQELLQLAKPSAKVTAAPAQNKTAPKATQPKR